MIDINENMESCYVPKYQLKIKNNIFHYETLFLTELSSKIFNSNTFD